MSIDTVTLFFAMLAIALQIAVVLLALSTVFARSSRSAVVDTLGPIAL